jgi:hypothetical protein
MVLKHLNGGKFKTKNETMVTQKSLVQESVDLVYCGSNQVNCDHRLNRNSVLECVSVTLEVKKKSRGGTGSTDETLDQSSFGSEALTPDGDLMTI